MTAEIRCRPERRCFNADGTKAHGDRWIDYVLVRTQAPAVARVADPRVELIHSESANCRYSDHHGLDVVFSLR